MNTRHAVTGFGPVPLVESWQTAAFEAEQLIRWERRAQVVDTMSRAPVPGWRQVRRWLPGAACVRTRSRVVADWNKPHPTPAEAEALGRVCAGCPVAEQCLMLAVVQETPGYRAGTTRTERTRLYATALTAAARADAWSGEDPA